MKMRSKTKLKRAAVVAGMVLVCNSVHAATDAWWDISNGNGLQGGVGTWSTSTGNWNSSANPGSQGRSNWTNGNNANFTSSPVGTVTVSGTVNVDKIKFDVAGYDIAGTTLNLVGTGSIVTNADATISAPIGGSVGLTKSGSGILTLSNTSNSFTNNLTISGGILAFSADTNLGNSNNDITLNGGAVGSTATSAYSLPSARVITLNNVAGNAIGATGVNGDITIANANQLTGNGGFSKAGTGKLTISSNNNFAGNVTISNGILVAGDANALGTTGTITNNATFAVASGTSFTRSVTLNSGSTLAGLGTYTPGSTVTVAAGRTLAPGINDGTNQVGKLTIGNSVTLQGVLSIDLDFSGAGSADQLAMTTGNTMTIGGTLYLNVLNGTVGPLGSTKTFTIIDNQDVSAISGDFANIIPGNAGNFLYTFSKTGGTGNDFTVSITSVPEPTSAIIFGSATIGAALIRRRRKIA